MNLACANKECKAELKYLRGGRLFLMERRLQAISAQANLSLIATARNPEPSRQPVALRRYFWLCEGCAEQYVIRRWTENGVELVPRYPKKRMPNSPSHSREWMMPGLVG